MKRTCLNESKQEGKKIYTYIYERVDFQKQINAILEKKDELRLYSEFAKHCFQSLL